LVDAVTAEQAKGFTWGPGYVYLNGQLIAQYGNSTTYFVHHDHLGTTRLMTNVNGTVYDSMDYMPFGEQIAGGSGTNQKFTGKQRDAESNLDNFGARYDSSSLGRFMSPNPTGGKSAFPQTWNAYPYVANNPLAAVDPNGLDCIYINSEDAGKSYVQSGDCTSDTDSGIFVNGTVTSFTYNGATGTFSFSGTNYPDDPVNIVSGELRPNPSDPATDLANHINQMNLTANTFKIYGIGAAVGATGGTACYFFCGSVGIGTVTTLGATVGGTAGPAATDPKLQNFISMLFQAGDQLPGGTAGAVRYEIRTGDLLSDAGHSIKAQDIINGLTNLMNTGTLSQSDTAIARALIEDLRSALSTTPW
jgi:RHS repeat-associated protein